MGPEQQTAAIRRRLSALLDLINRIYGTEKMILKAGKLEALSLIRSSRPAQQLLGLQRLVLENPTLDEIPTEDRYADIFDELEGALAALMARRSLEESLELRIKERLEEQHEKYLQEIKKEIYKEWGGVESPQTLKKYARTEKMFARQPSSSVQYMLRPAELAQFVVQC